MILLNYYDYIDGYGSYSLEPTHLDVTEPAMSVNFNKGVIYEVTPPKPPEKKIEAKNDTPSLTGEFRRKLSL